MQEEASNQKKRNFLPELEPAYSILEKISDQLESAGENQQKLQAALENSLTSFDQAKVIFLAENQPWLAAWVDLKKAALHCDLAEGANYLGRGVQVHTAMELINKTLTAIPDLPADLDLAAKLYITMIETLYQVRALFDKPDQLQALDDLISGVAENLGESIALDLSLRTEANDLKFTAGILEALADLEEDPEIKKDMLETSQDLERQAAGNLAISSPLDLSAYELSREEK
jgi:hypothetical protein